MRKFEVLAENINGLEFTVVFSANKPQYSTEQFYQRFKKSKVLKVKELLR